MIRLKGGNNVFIGELQTGPEPVLQELKASPFRKIRLRPLMMVCGHHWNENVTGEEAESWKNVLSAAGYEVLCESEGLLSRDEVIFLIIGQKGLSQIWQSR
jgi:sirohydrochlorin cobaltochelatase